MMATSPNAIDGHEIWLNESAVAWGYFHDLFRAPTIEQWRWLGLDHVREAWSHLSRALGEPHPNALPLPDDFATYEEQYLAAFDVGLPTPPCPLIESHWNKSEPTARILHEHVLFFRSFGLELRSAAAENADHLRHQLEFLAYLCRLEISERAHPRRPGMANEVARGRRDYLQRHLAAWIPQAAAKIARHEPKGWPAAWLALLADWCRLQQDLEAGAESERNHD